MERNGIDPLIWLGFNHDLSITGLMPHVGGSSRIQTYDSNPIQVSVISLYHGSLIGLTGRTRTCIVLLPKQVTNLWPTVSYMVREVGLEPTS